MTKYYSWILIHFHPNTPNFFELSENKFCGVSVGSMDWIIRSIENYSHHLFDGFTFPYYRYINSVS